LVFDVLYINNYMSTTFDFQIVANTSIPGLSLVMPQNEDAYNYLTEEAELAVLADGSAPLFTDNVGDFISDAGWAQLSTSYV
jgi:hypothetical protein